MGALATLPGMTLNKRGTSLRDRWAYANPLARWVVGGALLAVAALLLALLTACSAPVGLSDQVEGCPIGYLHVDIEVKVVSPTEGPLDNIPFALVIAAQSFDPEYGGILVEGVGVTGRNPYVSDQTTDADPPIQYDVLCIPADRAVAWMVRASYQHPQTAYELIQIELFNRGEVGAGNVMTVNDADARICLEQRRVELDELIDPERWYTVQCNQLSIPAGFTGQLPEPFPQPDNV